MNYRRVLRVTSGYLLWTTYQLRGLDPKSLRFRLSLWSILHFIIVALIYAVSFGHHFERSSLLKIALDLSPFLKNLMILHIWLGLKVFIFCIIEWRSLTGVLNGLVAVLTMKPESEEGSPRNDWRNELLTYLLFFITLTVAFGFGLYIAIEMDFELPPADHIMIALALFIPHFMLAGSLRLHNLSIWLIRHELAGLQLKLGLTTVEDKQPVVVEIINPVLKSNEGAVEMATNIPSEAVTLETYDKVLKAIQAIANYLKSWNGILQRQMFVLNGLNFNCLLYGIFTRIYFEKTWHLVFVGRNRRVFYAANYVIFACISMDYHLLIIIQMLFDRMKKDFSKEIEKKLSDPKSITKEKYEILLEIKRILKEQLNLKLFGLVQFKLWNFFIIISLMLLTIGIIILYQYFTDQIDAVAQLMDSNDED